MYYPPRLENLVLQWKKFPLWKNVQKKFTFNKSYFFEFRFYKNFSHSVFFLLLLVFFIFVIKFIFKKKFFFIETQMSWWKNYRSSFNFEDRQPILITLFVRLREYLGNLPIVDWWEELFDVFLNYVGCDDKKIPKKLYILLQCVPHPSLVLPTPPPPPT